VVAYLQIVLRLTVRQIQEYLFLRDIWQVKQPSLFHQMLLDVVKAQNVQELEQLFKKHTATGTNRHKAAAK